MFSAELIGQATLRTHQEEPSRNIKKHTELIKIQKLYFEETDVLKTFFIKNEVKQGFPGYNYALTKSENNIEIEKWLKNAENKNALTKEGLQKIELYLKNK